MSFEKPKSAYPITATVFVPMILGIAIVACYFLCMFHHHAFYVRDYV